MSDEHIKQKLLELIQTGAKIHKDLKLNRVSLRQINKFQISAESLLSLRFGKNSRFLLEFINQINQHNNPKLTTSSQYSLIISAQIGVLEAALYTLENGLTDDIFYQRELLIFNGMLDQAFEFLTYKLDLAAAMYGRVVLENTIKEFAKKNNVDSNDKFDQIIINLRKNELIHKPLENSLRANYEIGTWAAHGDEKFNHLTSSQINEFLSFIRDKVLTLA